MTVLAVSCFYPSWLREAILKKNVLPFGKSLNGLDPLLVFLGFFKDLFLKRYLRPTKVPQNVLILVILPNIFWKMSKQRE